MTGNECCEPEQSETAETCPCGCSRFHPVMLEWESDPGWDPGWCGRCGADLRVDGTCGPSAAVLVAAYESLLLAHAGTPRDCGFVQFDTWAEIARLEDHRHCPAPPRRKRYCNCCGAWLAGDQDNTNTGGNT